ncbi:MAG TPA: hypothetical protein DF296_10825 [Candidatus Margulisbacteria bacterium]|nr:hypothetical protein [Candidatus Margulisiibacteriota bacterium]
MEFATINRLIYNALITLSPVMTSKVSMFDLNDHYSHPPFLRFRFEGKPKDDIIYVKIKNAIDGFEGNLKWRLTTKNESENYIIMPSLIETSNEEEYLYKKEYYISVLGEDIYNRKIEDGINDIPRLAKAICNNY